MLRSQFIRLLKSVLALSLALLCLTGCGAQGPETKLVRKAIALEFAQTQQALSQQLRTPVPTFKIQHVIVREKTPLRIEGLNAYRMQGQYDADVKFPGRRYQQSDNSFDMYLQQQPPLPDTKVTLWRLAVPQKGGDSEPQGWETFALYDAPPG
jgi:hypothetical protein